MRTLATLSLFLTNLSIGFLVLAAAFITFYHFGAFGTSIPFDPKTVWPWLATGAAVAFPIGFMVGEIKDSFDRVMRKENPLVRLISIPCDILIPRVPQASRLSSHVLNCYTAVDRPLNKLVITHVERIFGVTTHDVLSMTQSEKYGLAEMVMIWIRQNGKPAGYYAEQWHGVFGVFHLSLAFTCFLLGIASSTIATISAIFGVGQISMPWFIAATVVFLLSGRYNSINAATVFNHQSSLRLHTFLVLASVSGRPQKPANTPTGKRRQKNLAASATVTTTGKPGEGNVLDGTSAKVDA